MHRLSFLFHFPKYTQQEDLQLVGHPEAIKPEDSFPQLFITKKFQKIHLNDHKAFIAGDPIYSGNINQAIEENNFNPERILKIIKGHFYFFLVNEKERKIVLSASLFNMFPIFYYEDERYFIAASDIRLISQVVEKQMPVNKKFILETVIFNYPLFDDTFYDDIKLLDTNQFIEVTDNKVKFNKYFDISEFYVSDPAPYKEKADILSELFISSYKDYIPDTRHFISLTGGFDGRTLTACGHYYDSNFKTFSFGTKLNDDVTVPLENARQVGIDFQPIYLDSEEYIGKAFLESGRELTALTSGYSNFIYVHSLFAAKLLSKESGYALTGFFGSELFRALHLTGAFCSRELVLFFKEVDSDKWIKQITETFKLKYLNVPLFKNEIDEVVECLISYKKRCASFETLNQFFYTYIMEETFRKVFGPQIFAQFNYLNVRTPFLDYNFIQKLFETDLAGVNNPFFVKNPFKRLKGQYLYANIIRKTFPELSQIKTQKGYTPQDLLTFRGKFNILLPFIIKKAKRRFIKPYLDNLSIISGLKHNQAYLSNSLLSTFFNKTELTNIFCDLLGTPETKRDVLSFAVAISEFYKTAEKEH